MSNSSFIPHRGLDLDWVERARRFACRYDYVNDGSQLLRDWSKVWAARRFNGSTEHLYHAMGVAVVLLEAPVFDAPAYLASVERTKDHAVLAFGLGFLRVSILFETGVDPGLPDLADPRVTNGLLSFINFCFMGAAFVACGCHRFVVSDGLAKQLCDTELRGLGCDDLRLPYECISVVPPAGLFYLDDDNPVAEIMVLEGGVNASDMQASSIRGWVVFVRAAHKKFFYQLRLRPGGSLEAALQSTLDEVEMGFVDVDMNSVVADTFRFLLNVVVYATHADAEIDEVYADPATAKLVAAIRAALAGTKRRARLEAQLETLSENRKQIDKVLGKSVRYLSRDDVDDSSAGVGVGGGRELSVRTRVQGHWRKQPYGPGSVLRKLIWIQPFWRGPEWGSHASSVSHKLG